MYMYFDLFNDSPSHDLGDSPSSEVHPASAHTSAEEFMVIHLISKQDVPLKVSVHKDRVEVQGPLDTCKYRHINTFTDFLTKALHGVIGVETDRIRVEHGLHIEGMDAGCPHAKITVTNVSVDGPEQTMIESLVKLAPQALTIDVDRLDANSTSFPADSSAALDAISREIIQDCGNEVIAHPIVLRLGERTVCVLSGRFHKKPDLSNLTPQVEERSLRFCGLSKSGEEIYFIDTAGSKTNVHVGKKEFSAQEIGKHIDSETYFLVTMHVTIGRTGKRIHTLVDFKKDLNRAEPAAFVI
jgi:hypothetical protein